jgi:hypothetical protein
VVEEEAGIDSSLLNMGTNNNIAGTITTTLNRAIQLKEA